MIFRASEKDFKDIVAILIDHDVSTADEPDTVNGAYLAKLCANDWGIYKTFTTVIGKTQIVLDALDLSDQEKQTVKDRLKNISDLIEAETKSMNRKMRARVGEKAAWYKLPDVLGE